MLLKRARFWLVLFVIVSLLSLVAACNKSEEDEDEGTDNTSTAETAKPPYTSKGNEGTITGKVSFSGEAPAPKPIDMNADSACLAKNPNPVAEDVVVKDGKLEYVFVYIKDGQLSDGKKIGDYSFTTPSTAVQLDQQGCHYRPHMLGLQTGQKLSITNSDATTHNIHPTPKNNPEWNQTQPNGAPPIEKTFGRAEVLIPVKCNQHPWMKAWIGVLSHPFFAVTKEDGSYQITNVPPGKYTLATWHEKYGEKTMEVTVGDKATVTTDFTYAPTGTASLQRGSLEILPALDIPMLAQH
jgi:plastocyanin